MIPSKIFWSAMDLQIINYSAEMFFEHFEMTPTEVRKNRNAT